MAEPQWFEPDPFPAHMLAPMTHPAEGPSTLGAFGRRAALATAPTAGGVAAFPAGAGVGFTIGGPIGAGVGGLIASLGGGYITEKAQDWLLGQSGLRTQLGIDEAQLAEDEAAHPTAAFLGGVAPQMLFMRPGWNGRMAAVAGGGIGAGVEAGTELASEGRIDPYKVLAQGAIGALLGRNTKLGDRVMAPGHALARSIPLGRGETTAGIASRRTLEDMPADMPEEHRTPDERAAAHVRDLEAMARESDPFAGSEAAHGERLAEATRAAATGRPSRVATMPPPITGRQALKERIAHHESRGSYTAQSGNSTATGKYQFIDATWIGFAARAGNANAKAAMVEGRGSAAWRQAVADKRTASPALQEQVMDRALDEYKMAYRAAGIEPTDGDLYLMHALGQKAVKIAKAPLDTPIASLVSASEMAANPGWLKGTAGDVRGEFVGRTGGAGRPEAMAEKAAAGDAPPPMPELPPVLRDRADALMPLDLPETRGKGVQYHGARGEIPSLTAGFYNDANIYGGADTFYTTDAMDIASGYGRKNADARIYQTREREPVRFFDMEEKGDAATLLRRFGIQDPQADGFIPSAVEDALAEHGGTANLREVMDMMRETSREWDLTTNDVQEYLDAAITNLKGEGYGGMRHVGGLRTSRAAHEVKIYFDAPSQIELTDVTPARREAPARAPTMETPLRDPAPPRSALPPTAEPTLSRYDDPAGADASRETDLIEHDLRMAIEADPSLTVMLNDDGDVVNVADMLAGFDDSMGQYDLLRTCLTGGTA